MGLKPKSAEERSLRHSQCRVFSISCSPIVAQLSQLHWPPERPHCHRRHGNSQSCLFLFFYTCTKWSLCDYQAIIFSYSTIPVPIVNAKRFAPTVILSHTVRVVHCFVFENYSDCAEIPLPSPTANNMSKVDFFVCFFRSASMICKQQPCLVSVQRLNFTPLPP